MIAAALIVSKADAALAAPTIPLEQDSVAEKASAKTAPGKPKQVPPPKTPQKPAELGEPEFELEQEYELVLEAEPLVPAYDQRPPEKPIAPRQPEPGALNAAPSPPAGTGVASDQFLAPLAKEIDQLGIGELSPGFSGTTPSAQPLSIAKPASPSAPSTASGALQASFDRFRSPLGQRRRRD